MAGIPKLSIFKPNRFGNKSFFSPALTVGQSICFIVGMACIVGFLIDIVVLGAPFTLSYLEWRTDFLQQIASRSIIFLFGIALLLYCVFDQRHLKQPLAVFCLVLGVISLVSSILVIHDSLEIRDRTFRDINDQEVQIQSRIEESRSSGELPDEISLSELEDASKTIAAQAQGAKLAVGQDITKSGAGTVGNLVIVGIGLIGLSRIGMRREQIHP